MSIFSTELNALSHAIRGFEISAEASYKAKDEKRWKRSMKGLVEVVEELIGFLDCGWKTNKNVGSEK